jgi:hypothetical protein
VWRIGTAKAAPYVWRIGTAEAAPYVWRCARPRWATVLVSGAGVGVVGLLGFGIAHALLILPIWTQLLRGLPFALVAGVTFAWAYDAVARRRGSRSLMYGVQFGALMAVTLVPATLVNAALRLGGVRMQDSMAGAALAAALAIASGAASGWLLTRRRDVSWAFAVATVTMTLAAGGPLPVAQSVRSVWLSLAFVPICLAGGIVVAALRARFSRQETK